MFYSIKIFEGKVSCKACFFDVGQENKGWLMEKTVKMKYICNVSAQILRQYDLEFIVFLLK